MSKKSFLFLIIFLILFNFFIFEKAKAGISDNISGWAWSENIGWISFNCYNDYNGDGILEDHCSSSNYGVKLDPSTKIFSGYAWSENIGWLTFNESELTGCPQSPCRAWLDSSNNVQGWARALAYGGGWSGWIKLRGPNYGVSLNPSTNEFDGWAWSDMVMGWISFNCKNQNSCPTSNYKVLLTTSLNLPPVVTSTSDSQNPCAWGTIPQVASGLSVTLSWTYSDPNGDPQAAYEIWLDDNSSFPDPKFNHLVTTSSANSYSLNLSDDDNSDWLSSLNWATTYYWKVRVKDSAGNWSNWSTIDSFTTPLHAYPYIDFSWTPTAVVVNATTTFIDKSDVYGGATKKSWFWTFQDGVPATSGLQNPTIKFISEGSKNVSLRVTDSDNFSCTDSKTINIRRSLPEWKEVPPL
jgi:hypothetical protein